MGKVSEILLENEGLQRQLGDCEGRAEKLASEAARRIRKYQRQASLDLRKMADLQGEILARDELLAEMQRLLEIVDYYEPWWEGDDVVEISISVETAKEINQTLRKTKGEGTCGPKCLIP